MKQRIFRQAARTVVCFLLAIPTGVQAYLANPDLTAAGVIAAMKADDLLASPQYSPRYSETYNLGATGLRGWIYIDRNNMGAEGLQTARSRQILVKVASTPGSAVLAADDVILGAMAASSGTVPVFTSDCRKAIGVAIGEAEKTGAGTLRVKRWRTGTTTDENIPITIMGDYSTTAPYGNCAKSALILANAITKLNQETLSNGWTGAASGLALLAAVKPGDANYAAVQTKLQTFARSIAPASLKLTGCNTWNWGYVGVFLSEYYLRTVADGSPDGNVLHGIHEYTVALAKGQSMYGTFGHGGAEQHADGSLHGSISWYGPVNSAGLIANLAIVIGKKALLAGSMPIDPEIDPAIARASGFFAYFVNKGGIPYGEHEPWSGGHASNGKDAMAAVMFGLQDNKPVETEYFTRMSVAGWVGREYGHTGQGFSYFWSALGAAMGGDAAAAAHLNQVRWHLDLERRTDGSFVYDGGEQYGANTTSTYLGSSSYSGMSPNACFVLAYALPLKRIHITGRNANPVNTLDAAKVANEIAAATYERDCVTYSVPTLIAALSEYDPVLRHDAAAELAKRTLTATEESSLIAMITHGTLSADANVRQGACETLGIRKTTGALTALGQRLSDTDQWVRGKASNALRNFGSAASGQLTTMLTAFTANATDPDVIVWSDPIQIANGYLANTLFQALSSNTNALAGAARSALLYPALLAGLKQPDGMARMYLGGFIQNNLTLADVQAVAAGIVTAAAERSPADRMFSDVIRYNALNTLAKYKIEEGIPLCLKVKEQTWHGDDWLPFDLLTTAYRGAARDALPTLYKWQEHIPQFAADSSINGCCPGRLDNIINHLAATIAAIEGDTSPPALTRFKSITASANPSVVTLPTTTTVLTPVLTDLDGGTPNFVWSRVSGPGAVSFNPSGMAANTTCTATFNTPGTYVLRATAVDRSILDYNTWITYSLGYFDFQTYDEILGAVTTDLTVTVASDPNRAPVPRNQSLTTPLDTDVSITLAATDPNGDALTYAIVTGPAHGSLTGTAPDLTYTPATGYTGPDSFTFTANDGTVDSAAATITIDVAATGNRRPLAANQYVTTPEDTGKTVTLGGTDPDSDPLTYQIVSGPIHGVLIGTAPNLTYLPAANYPAGNTPGSDSFTFTVSDAALASAVARVSITVTPVNDAPLALEQSASMAANTAKPIALTGLDAEGYALTYVVVTNPSHGTLSGFAPNLNYQPTMNYRGADSFTFRVTDSEGVASSVAMVSITIVNDPPVATPQSVELPPNTSKAVTLTGSDVSNDPLTYAVLTQPAHGVLTGTAPNVTYTPATDYTGADSFTFTVNDGANDSPAATVTLNVAQSQTWTNIASGAWSTGTNWSGGSAPAAGGTATGLLVFNTGTYSGASTNDLAGVFLLNRLNLGSALPALTLNGNPLSFALNSATQPQINQNSAKAVTVSNNITLTANTTLGGSGAGAVTLSGMITGAGGLSKTTGGTLTLSSATTANSHSGGTAVTAGTLVLNLMRTNLGTGAVTLAGGTTFYTTNFEGNSSGGAISNTFNLGGGWVTLFTAKDIWLTGSVTGPGGLVITGNGRTPGVMLAGAKTFSGGVKLTALNGENPTVAIDNINSLGTGTLRSELPSTNLTAGNLEARAAVTTSPGVLNPIELATGCRLVVKADGSSNLWLSGPITGSGSLVKVGTATLTVSGSNTYGGKTTVSGGTLVCSTAASLGGGALAIGSDAKVTLNFSGTRPITALSFGGTAQPNGTYGSTASPAANKNDTWFSGIGTVTVAPATSTALVLTGGITPCNPGDALTFTATVTGSTPTGNVAFYAGATLLGTSALNASYQASVTTGLLAVGANNVTASYAGNPNNGASTSEVLPIQVLGPLAPPTHLAAMAGNNMVGLTWSATDGASGYYVKRAIVSGGPYITIGTASGTGYSDASALNGTTYYYVVSATNNFGEGANSGLVGATPTPPLSSTTTLASSLGSTGAYGLTVTFTATVAVTGGPATGTVTFKDGATVLGTGTLSSGQATYAIGTLAGGGHSITATYGGSLAFEGSGSAAFGYTVSRKSVTITGVTAGNKTYNGSTAAVLTVGALSGVINGDTVTVLAGTGAFASANVGTWAVTATGYALGGTHGGNYVLASQPSVPDATITAVTGVMFTLTNLNIGAAATGAEILNAGTLVEANHFYGTNAPVTLANGLTFGTNWSHTIPAGWSGGQNTSTDQYGCVPLLTSSTPYGVLMRNYTWSSAETHTLTIPGLTPGRTYRLQLISVAGKNAGVVVEASTPATWTDTTNGTPSLLTAIWVQGTGDTQLDVTLTRNHSFPGTHDNELAANGYVLHDITPPSSAKDMMTFTFPTYGAATISGNNITLSVPLGTPVTAMSPTYTASPNATGSPVSGASRNFTSPQTYTITGQDLSTKSYTVTVAPLVQPTGLAATPGNNSVGLTWTVVSGASGYKVKRSLTSGGPAYSEIGTSAGTGYTDGTAVNGTTYYYVVSATSGAGESANSSQVSVIPSALSSATTLASSLGATGVYGSVTFTATVTTAATGTVTFRDGATLLGTATLAAGTAAYSTSTLVVGVHSITATYEGDTTYAASGSAPFSYAVSARTVTVTGMTAADKVYDGTTAAVLTGGTVSGSINSDAVTVVAGTGTFASPNAGIWAVSASGCALGGANAGNYVLSPQPTVANASITARTVQLAGTRAYDATMVVAAADLTVSNKVGGDDLSLTGSANLAGKDAGAQAILTSYATPARVQFKSGSANNSSTITVTMSSAPANGNTLVAVISTRRTSISAVSSISQSGATWVRAEQTAGTAGSTTEIWYASNVSGAATNITINLAASMRAAAVVAEYSGLLTASPLDKKANTTSNSTAASTNTTAATAQTNELWIGGIGLVSSGYTLTVNSGSLTSFANTSSGSGTPTNNARVYALEYMATATGNAGSGGTVSTSSQWSGAIATFKAATTSSLALTGTAAGNYTLSGVTGTVTITPAALTITANKQSKTYGQSVTFGSGSTQFTGTALQLGETIGSVTLTCAGGGAAAAAVASYPITPGAATGGSFTAANYTISYVPGALTIIPAEQSITFGMLAAMTYGEAPFYLTATADSGLPVGYVSSDPTVAGVSGGTVTILKAGTTTLTASQPGDTNHNAATPVAQLLTVNPAPLTSFETWAANSTRGFSPGVNDGLLQDPDGDGISNLLEFVLGGEPMVDSQAILPRLTPVAGAWIFEYDRSDLSLAPATTQVVEYGDDLTGWTAVAIPVATDGSVTITPGTASDHVKVIIPGPGPGTGVFARLKVSQ